MQDDAPSRVHRLSARYTPEGLQESLMDDTDSLNAITYPTCVGRYYEGKALPYIYREIYNIIYIYMVTCAPV